MKTDSTMNTEFAGNQWICPDIDEFSVNNNPYLYKYGKGTNLVMVVNDCAYAKTMDSANNLVSYADADNDVACLDEDSTNSTFVMRSKLMTKDAQSPEDYFETGTL